MNSASPRLLHLTPLLGVFAALYFGCGGKVVVDASSSGGDGGTGGAGGSTSPTSVTTAFTGTSVGVTTGTGADCGTLAQIYEKSLFAAAQCNACIDFDGCFNGPVFTDTCGCPTVLNSGQQDLLAAAKQANTDWLGAGCQPFACGKPCFAGASWSCHPGANGSCLGSCQPN